MQLASTKFFWGWIFILSFVFLCGTAFADVQKAVDRIFELNAKLKPGMPADAINELLGPPAEEYQMGNKASAVKRLSWLHGEMGIEIYFMGEVAYKVNLTLRFNSDKENMRALDALTRKGNSKYGAMPRFDHATAEYYWVAEGVRFGFSKYNSNTVLSTCTKIE